MAVLTGFNQSAEVLLSPSRPELAAEFEPPLPLQTRRFHRAGPDGPAAFGHRLIVHSSRMAQLAQQGRRPFIRRGHGQRESQLLLPARTHLLIGRKAPPLPQRATPMPVRRMLTMPDADFNDAGGGVQMEAVGVPVNQPPSAVGGKLRLVRRRVVAVLSPTAGASTPALRPSPSLQSEPTFGRFLQVSSWCFRSCGVVVLRFHEEPNTQSMGELSRCTPCQFQMAAD